MSVSPNRPWESKPHKCQYCSTMIFHGKTKAGKWMPFEAQAVDVYIPVYTEQAGPHFGRIMRGYIPHWGRCPGTEQAKEDTAKRRAQSNDRDA